MVNTGATTKEVDEILKKMKFKLRFIWSYDPLGIISKMRVEKKTNPYAHKPSTEIEQYANQEQWTENTIQQAEEKIVSQSSLQTPIPKDKEIKRPRESMFPTD